MPDGTTEERERIREIARRDFERLLAEARAARIRAAARAQNCTPDTDDETD
jgi:hypothetical protein